MRKEVQVDFLASTDGKILRRRRFLITGLWGRLF
jgi:hypothetical protein